METNRRRFIVIKKQNMMWGDDNSDNSGYIVRHTNGKTGRTYHRNGLINGKVPVYFDGEKRAVLCSAEKLKVIGLID